MSLRFAVHASIVWLALPSLLQAQTLFVDVLDQEIQGSWQWSTHIDDRVTSETDTLDLDFNLDQTVDARIRHRYADQPLGLSTSAVDLLTKAGGGISQAESILKEMRATVLAGLDAGLGREHDIALLNARLNASVDALRLLSDSTSYGGTIAFQHAPGRYASSDSRSIGALTAGPRTPLGRHEVVVTTAAQRAFVEADVAQTSPLSADETLIINHVPVPLSRGATQIQVVERINASATQTGAMADLGPNGATRVYSVDFGESSNLEMVSTSAAAADSTGFGTSYLSDHGVDVMADVGHAAYTGVGLKIQAGKGLGIEVLPNSQDPLQSQTGSIGVVSVTDNPLASDVVVPFGASSWQGIHLLDGSSGKALHMPDRFVTALSASEQTFPGLIHN